MVIKGVAQIVFLGAGLILAVLSIIMIYVLLRFGQSKVLALLLSAFYLLLMTSLWAAAISNFNQIPFSELEL